MAVVVVVVPTVFFLSSGHDKNTCHISSSSTTVDKQASFFCFVALVFHCYYTLRLTQSTHEVCVVFVAQGRRYGKKRHKALVLLLCSKERCVPADAGHTQLGWQGRHHHQPGSFSRKRQLWSRERRTERKYQGGAQATSRTTSESHA